MPARAELIILAAPSQADDYYETVEEQIFDFHIHFSRQILAAGDDVIILSDREWYDDYAKVLGASHVAIAPMADIWMRDFSLSNAMSPVLFRYTAAGQGGSQFDSDSVQKALIVHMDNAGVNYLRSSLLNDGGNFVDDYAGNVVMSTKFLADNHLDENEARRIILSMPQVENVAFIEADEQGGLEHADGVVSFIEPNTLLVNSYPEDPDYARQLKQDLRRGLPGVIIHEMVTPYDGRTIYDDKFGSACGLYTNALVTPDRIYFPQFGIKEDKTAISQLRMLTTKQVIPVLSEGICHMGGGVRCMSWQVRGSEAKKLRQALIR